MPQIWTLLHFRWLIQKQAILSVIAKRKLEYVHRVGTAQKMQVHTTSFIEKASASTFISSSSSSSGFAGK